MFISIIWQVFSACKHRTNNQNDILSNKLFTWVRASLLEVTRAPWTWPGSPMQTHNSTTLNAGGMAGKQTFSLRVAENKGSGNSKHVGLNSYSAHMCNRRREHVVCVSKCAWIPISYAQEGGFFFFFISSCPNLPIYYYILRVNAAPFFLQAQILYHRSRSMKVGLSIPAGPTLFCTHVPQMMFLTPAGATYIT